jgi:hypothetical protein
LLEAKGVTEANWQDQGKKDGNFLESESPLYVGRAVAALAADSRMLDRTSQLWSSWEPSRDYGFSDTDGRRPDWGSRAIDFSGLPPSFLEMFRTGLRLQQQWLDRLQEHTGRLMGQLPGNRHPREVSNLQGPLALCWVHSRSSRRWAPRL